MSVALTQRRNETVDFDKIRSDFPILEQSIRGKRLVYLDNAATSQKPKSVIEALKKYYEQDNANIHRGVHLLSERATELHEAAREKVRAFLNAAETAEIIFCRGATEAINLVAQTFGRANLTEGDEVIVSALEHHSNIVPWQMVCQQTRAKLKVIPMNDRGELLFEEYEKLLSDRTKLVSVIHVSNALGTVNPVKAMIAEAHARGIPVLLDGAQSTPHMKIDVKDLDCDFFAFSGHKTCGPTGIGVLYGKRAFLEKMPPYQGGGDMIRMVSFEKTLYNDIPFKFEAGTPHIEGAIGLGAAIDYLTAIGMDRIAAREAELLAYASERLSKVEGIRFIGTAKEKAGVVSFLLGDIHPHDIGTILDQEGIAIRTGHHCAMPIMERLHIPATARASLAFYNTKADIDALADGLEKVKAIFQ
ncbi:MAG TPA: cysteine desulfurase [bacterium]|nr:cysteine desulfurase [bacterium]